MGSQICKTSVKIARANGDDAAATPARRSRHDTRRTEAASPDALKYADPDIVPRHPPYTRGSSVGRIIVNKNDLVRDSLECAVDSGRRRSETTALSLFAYFEDRE